MHFVYQEKQPGNASATRGEVKYTIHNPSQPLDFRIVRSTLYTNTKGKRVNKR